MKLQLNGIISEFELRMTIDFGIDKNKCHMIYLASYGHVSINTEKRTPAINRDVERKYEKGFIILFYVKNQDLNLLKSR